MAIFRWFAAMATHMDAVVLENYLVHVLNPTYRITDDDTIHDKAMGKCHLSVPRFLIFNGLQMI